LRAGENKLNILIIVLDSYRGLTYWDEGEIVSPELWSLHSDFAAYRNAHTTTSWTLPSHVTLFTGLYASEHENHSGAYKGNIELGPNLKTLAELAKEKGYSTAGFSSNPWVGENSGLNRGFDQFVEFNFRVSLGRDSGVNPFPLLSKMHGVNRFLTSTRTGILKRPQVSRMMTDWLLKFVGNLKDGQNFFAFINLMDGHNPYQPPKNLLKKFGTRPKIRSEYKFNRELDGYMSGRRQMDEALLSNTRAYYQASLAHGSYQVGRIIQALENSNYYDDTAIFICSDHGKTLGEYDRKRYPLHYITDVNTHILLSAKTPQLQAGQHDQVVSLIDVFYSALEILGESSNPNYNLKRSRLGDRETNNDWVANETLIPYSGKKVENPDLVRSITDGRFKYVCSDQRGEILWDKRTDPGQMRNVMHEFPEVLQAARAAFNNWQGSLLSATHKEGSGSVVGEMDKEVLKQLQSLGYF